MINIKKLSVGLFVAVALGIFTNLALAATTIVDEFRAESRSGAVVSGGVTVVEGKSSKAYKFDGTGYIKTANKTNLNFDKGPFTIEVLFNWSGAPGINNIVRKSNYPVSGHGAGYWLRVAGGQLDFFVGETVGYENASRGRISTSIKPGVWYRVVAYRDSAGMLSLYLNGELKGRASATGAETTSNAPFTIGAWDDRFGVTEFFSGEIEEVIIYKGSPDEDKGEIKSDIKFPIKELGNCANHEECREYCNEDQNIPRCIQYSIDHDLISDDEKKNARKLLDLMDPSGAPGECRDRIECLKLCDSVATTLECIAYAERNGLFRTEIELRNAKKLAELLEAGVKFPGDCQTQSECEEYCSESSHLEECVAFAERAGFIEPDELEMYKKVQPYIARGETPGGCKEKEECEDFCNDPNNIEECFAFAERAGLIPPDELEDARKAIEFIKRGEAPGGCRSKEECEEYCEEEGNLEECVEFALKAGMIAPEEAEMARKFMKTGGPGGCKSRESCEEYCNNPDNMEACLKFAEEAGLISSEEAEMARKVGVMGGPGGCKSEEECEEYCEENQEECMDFAREHGMISEEEVRHMEEGIRQMKEMLSGPAGECVKNALGPKFVEMIESGKMMMESPPEGLEETIGACLESMMMKQMEGGSFEEGRGFEEGPPQGSFEGRFRGGFESEGDFGNNFEDQYRKQYEEEFRKQEEQMRRQFEEQFRNFESQLQGQGAGQ